MKVSIYFYTTCFWIVVALCGCNNSAENAPTDTNTTATAINKDTTDDTSTITNDVQFHEALLEVGRNYQTWGRVDDETRWAPFLCRLPLPSQVGFSDSSDANTHGQKLYFLFAKDREAYVQYAGQGEVAVGQVIVKQAWRPEKIETSEPPDPAYQLTDNGGHYNPIIQRDGETFRASDIVGLYVMMKLAPTTTNTDRGWVYATLSADGKTVTSAGSIASCMNCHNKTSGDRIFGLQ